MEVLSEKIRKTAGRMLLAAGATLALTACDPILDNDYGDCTVRHYVTFKYDYNLLNADAFATQVESVTLYAFDADSMLTHTLTATQEEIDSAGGRLSVPFDPANHHLVAWCHNVGCTTTELPEAVCGETTLSQLTCRIGGRTVDAAEGCTKVCEIGPIFHGMVERGAQPTNPADELNPTYLVPLMKNTNTVRIILQNQSSDPLNAEDFDFRFVEENGLMNYDNRLLADEPLTYVPFYLGGGSVEYEGAESRSLTADDATRSDLNMVVAEFTIGRLMADRNPYLTVTNRRTGKTVFSIPLINYLRIARSQYHASMPDQEYLDRVDTFALTFLLDSHGSWSQCLINILSWRIVINNVEMT